MCGFRLSWPRLLSLLGMTFLVLLGVAVAPVRPAYAVSNVQVFVGYADDARANPTQFPTPWANSPGVVFAGCHTSCVFDAGAVRFVNNTSQAVTISSLAVKIGPSCTFNFWPPSTVLQSGQQLIITQTLSSANALCVNDGSFDTSDIGVLANCAPNGIVPEIDATIDGVANTFMDTGQVLNTGGVDAAGCPPVSGNESLQWTSVGSVACPGATLTLAPASQTRTVGSMATETATLQNTCGVGLQGASIGFATQPGSVNPVVTGSATTDVNGNAVFSYTSAVTGTDTLQASTSNPAGTITSNTATVTWVKTASRLSITGGATTSDFNDPATVAAVLSDSGGPLPGEPVTFTLNGIETCTGTTDSNGSASCSLTPAEAAGTYPLVASFGGDATHNGTGATASFVVTLEETTLAYTGPARAANGQPLTLSGVLKEDGATPIAGRPVTFTIGTGGSAQSCTGTTAAGGSAACSIASVNQPASSTTVPVTAVFAGDAFYKSASASATLKFQFMTGRAFGIESSGLVTLSPTPDTGPVVTAGATTVSPPCVVTIAGLITAHTLCAKVVTAVNPGTSTATASVQDATIGVLGVPVIKIGLVQSSSKTTCASSTGDVTISSISVGGVPVNVNLHPGPNTTVTVLGVTLVLNEQFPVAGADQGLTVNAVHVSVAGLLDVIVASATSDIHNC
ncbi:MAG TPA: choice-of-anchor P family protein [Candidatus Dormibacteraeota bacterium]